MTDVQRHELGSNWDEQQCRLFIDVHRSLVEHKCMFVPQLCWITDEHWGVISWNAAWCAADKLRGIDIVLVDNEGVVIDTDKPGPMQ